MIRRTATAAALALCATVLASAPAQAASTTSFHRWSTPQELRAGSNAGTTVDDAGIRLTSGARATKALTDPYSQKKTTFDYGWWTSPWHSTGFKATRIVPSWNARALDSTWVRIEARVRSGSTVGSWDTVAEWAFGSTVRTPASGAAQTDDLVRLATDTLVVTGSPRITAWQIKVTLFRPHGTTRTPRVTSIGAVASNYAGLSVATSKTTMTKTVDLKVPQFSQMIHRGQHPQWGGGGAAWCSPTSTAMVLRYHDSGPKPSHYHWSPYADSQVNHAARYTYDRRYGGTGNWPFNTAYASRYGLDAFVTRFTSLRDAEQFIKAGIPVVATIKFGSGELSGAPISSTAGHLVVIRGFASDGRVIVNDPAAPSNSSVRRVYNRAQFERAWLKNRGGIVYVIRPHDVALPTGTARW